MAEDPNNGQPKAQSNSQTESRDDAEPPSIEQEPPSITREPSTEEKPVDTRSLYKLLTFKRRLKELTKELGRDMNVLNPDSEGDVVMEKTRSRILEQMSDLLLEVLEAKSKLMGPKDTFEWLRSDVLAAVDEVEKKYSLGVKDRFANPDQAPPSPSKPSEAAPLEVLQRLEKAVAKGEEVDLEPTMREKENHVRSETKKPIEAAKVHEQA
jgi:hypothetical protein